jgi:protein-S-isoprenylcysteine O-methyltransferase Ste14
VSTSLRSTSTRTFVALPVVAALESVVRRRRPKPAFLLLLPWGYLQYKLCGRYRTRHGGGGPGMSRPPERVVTTGPYALTRNPLYLGHVVFLTGLSLATRSRVVGLITVALLPWFDARAREDETRLAEMFGSDYEAYRDSVPRWVGLVAAGRR